MPSILAFSLLLRTFKGCVIVALDTRTYNEMWNASHKVENTTVTATAGLESQTSWEFYKVCVGIYPQQKI